MLSKIARQLISPRGTTRADRVLPFFRSLRAAILSPILDDVSANSQLDAEARPLPDVSPLPPLEKITI